MLRGLRVQARADRRQDPPDSLFPTLRVIDFQFYRVGTLKSVQKIPQMGRLGDNIEREMGADQRPCVFVPLCEDDLRNVGVRLFKSLQDFRPQFEGVVDVNQQNPSTGDRQ